MIYRLVKILGNKISLEDLRAKVVIAERALLQKVEPAIQPTADIRVPIRGLSHRCEVRTLLTSPVFYTLLVVSER